MPKVDTKKCIGCGLCTSIYPEGFEIGNDGKAHFKDIKNYDKKKVKEAADSCPAQAITP